MSGNKGSYRDPETTGNLSSKSSFHSVSADERKNREAAEFFVFLLRLSLFAQQLRDTPEDAVKLAEEAELLEDTLFSDSETLTSPLRQDLAELRSHISTHSVQESIGHIRGATGKFANAIDENGPLGPIRTYLLNTITKAESVGSSYNVAFGGHAYDLVNMTINEVRNLQKDIIAQGGKSSAMGRYQIMGYTMDDLIKKMGLTGNEKFDIAMQDQMGFELIKRRGFDRFIAGRMSAEDFANNLTKEWAGWKNSGGRGEYDNDGINKAHGEFSTLVDAANKTKTALFQQAAQNTGNRTSNPVVEGQQADHHKPDPTTTL